MRGIPPSLTRAELEERVRSVRTWYHCIDLGHGVVTPGAWDMRQCLAQYGIPSNLSDQDVIDVGTSNGFFAFEMERRGARVTATELETFADHDVPAWYREARLREMPSERVAETDWSELHGAFEVVKAILGSGVERVFARVEELPSLLTRRFDLALFSNVLTHVRDPVGALESVRMVLKPGARLIVAGPTSLREPEECYAVFVGDPATFAWWLPSRTALAAMCRMAGFVDVRVMAEFDATRRVPPISSMWVTVIHATRPPEDRAA